MRSSAGGEARRDLNAARSPVFEIAAPCASRTEKRSRGGSRGLQLAHQYWLAFHGFRRDLDVPELDPRAGSPRAQPACRRPRFAAKAAPHGPPDPRQGRPWRRRLCSARGESCGAGFAGPPQKACGTRALTRRLWPPAPLFPIGPMYIRREVAVGGEVARDGGVST